MAKPNKQLATAQRCLFPEAKATTHIPQRQSSTNTKPTRPRASAESIGSNGRVFKEALFAVVRNVSVAEVVPLAGSVKGESVQVISSSAVVPQVLEERVPDPVKPLRLLNVKTVDPERPGAEIVTEVGFEDKVKPGVVEIVTTTTGDEDEL